MDERRVLLAASILTADFGNLYRVVRKLERAGVDRFHLDVMDGHFVPHLTFGPDVVGAFRRLTRLPLDLHLMISEPSRYVHSFIEAGGDSITFHVEVPESHEVRLETLREIRRAGRRAGLAVSPRTPVRALEAYAGEIDIAMIMTVEPGFGGQKFMHDCAAKIADAHALPFAAAGPLEVHVDGGVSRETAREVGGYGADVLVVGSALFERGLDVAREIGLVKALAAAGPSGPDEPHVAPDGWAVVAAVSRDEAASLSRTIESLGIRARIDEAPAPSGQHGSRLVLVPSADAEAARRHFGRHRMNGRGATGE